MLRHSVLCHHCRNKIYFATEARRRSELPVNFSLKCYSCSQILNYYNNQVLAETGELNRTGGAVLGGLIGLAASGGTAAILGAILGGLIGESYERTDRQTVEEFNNSV